MGMCVVNLFLLNAAPTWLKMMSYFFKLKRQVAIIQGNDTHSISGNGF